jgi:predicted CXXCH cytochrome family protein
MHMNYWIRQVLATALLAFALGAIAWISLPELASAGEASMEIAAVPAPVVPEASAGTECVRDPEFMRRNHMEMLKHKRDLTVHEGNRLPEFSLNECIACHAVKGDDGKNVTVADSRHFCRSCHDYAAVKVDCFQCHASRPESGDTALQSSPHGMSVLALGEFLKEVE